MTKGLYVIFDKVANAVAGPVMTYAHDAVATRAFMDIAGNKDSSLYQHVEDYDLLCVGVLDEEKCVVSECDEPHTIVSGVALKEMRDGGQTKLALEA